MPDAGGLQLLPVTRKKLEIKVPGQNRLVVFSIMIFVIVLLIYTGLVIYKNRLTSSSTGIAGIDNQLADLESSRDKQTEKNLLALHQQLLVINPILSAHFFWSNALSLVQNNTLQQVQFQTINADIAGKKFVIKMWAADYTTVAKQIAAYYTIDSVTDILINKIQSQPTGKLDVTMQLTFDVVKFLNKSFNQVPNPTPTPATEIPPEVPNL